MKLRFVINCILLLCIVSCNTIPNKSILEPLSAEELLRIIKSEEEFADFYEDYWDEYGDIINSLNELEKAKFLDITYNELYSCYLFQTEKRQDSYIEWKQKYGDSEAKADSIIKQWKEYVANNSLEKYLKIEFTQFSAHPALKQTDYSFTLTPLQGAIENVVFRFRFTKKSDFLSLTPRYGSMHTVTYNKYFNEPAIAFWVGGLYDSNNNYIGNLSERNFRSNYEIETEIISVTKDGIEYNFEKKIPKSVRNYLKAVKDNEPLLASYKKDVIIELINPEYLDSNAFITAQSEELIKNKYPQIASFHLFIEEKENSKTDEYWRKLFQDVGF